MTRRGFTLIETMIALVVTGLVVSLAWAAMQAGLDTRERLAVAQGGAEKEAVARSLLARALRHTVAGTIGGAPVFLLQDRAGDALRFRTRGIVQPFGASAVWEVSLLPAPSGVELDARAIDGTSSFVTVLPAVHALDVRVRSRDIRDGWLDSWPAPERSPAVVAITFLDAAGRSRGSPLVVRVGLEGTP